MIHYTGCPVCNSKHVALSLTASDHTVTGQSFPVWKCDNCTLMFTQDIPAQESIGAYYVSENYISHSDTRKGLVNKLYHTVRKRTLASKLKLVIHETGLTQGNMLDIGSGTGAFLHTMKKAGWNVTGIEPDEQARAKASANYGLETLPASELFNLSAGRFNAITMWHVLEHVHQLHEYVAQLKKLLAPGGKLFIAVPNYTSYDAGNYRENWAAYDVPRHLYHFSPQSMNVLMKLHGLSVLNIKPMWFDSFYVAMLSEQYKNKKGSLVRAGMIGLLSNMKTIFNRQRCSSVIYVISA